MARNEVLDPFSGSGTIFLRARETSKPYGYKTTQSNVRSITHNQSEKFVSYLTFVKDF
jgi:hypothetical protein